MRSLLREIARLETTTSVEVEYRLLGDVGIVRYARRPASLEAQAQGRGFSTPAALTTWVLLRWLAADEQHKLREALLGYGGAEPTSALALVYEAELLEIMRTYFPLGDGLAPLPLRAS
jgi:hypothetical protein